MGWFTRILDGISALDDAVEAAAKSNTIEQQMRDAEVAKRSRERRELEKQRLDAIKWGRSR